MSFYFRDYILLLKSHLSTIEQLLEDPTYKSNPSGANERVRPFVQNFDLVFKRITYLLTLKR